MRPIWVLVVEDDPDDQAFIAAALRACGLGVDATMTSDGVQALEVLQGAADSRRLPAVILLDLMLPKLSGFEVLERLRADSRTAAVPVAVFTSSDQPQDVARAYELGANSYVRKPVEPDDFAAAVAQIARYWTARNIAACGPP